MCACACASCSTRLVGHGEGESSEEQFSFLTEWLAMGPSVNISEGLITVVSKENDL